MYARDNERAVVRTDGAKVIRVLTTACGSSEDFHRLLDRIDKPLVKSQARVSASQIVAMMGKFNEYSRKFREIGSFQYAAVFLAGEMKVFTPKEIGHSIPGTLDNSVRLC